MPDSGTEFGARARRRLREDMVGWLTSTDQSGTPQPAPVWFLWDEEHLSALVYSRPAARRLARIKVNPRAALHLNDLGAGHDFVVLTGWIAEHPDAPPPDRHTAYAEKYGDWMAEMFGSAERFAREFSTPLILRPQHIRGR